MLFGQSGGCQSSSFRSIPAIAFSVRARQSVNAAEHAPISPEPAGTGSRTNWRRCDGAAIKLVSFSDFLRCIFPFKPEKSPMLSLLKAREILLSV